MVCGCGIVVQKRGDIMADIIEETIFDIITGNDPVLASKVLSNIISDIESGEDVMSSIEINCEIMFG